MAGGLPTQVVLARGALLSSVAASGAPRRCETGGVPRTPPRKSCGAPHALARSKAGNPPTPFHRVEYSSSRRRKLATANAPHARIRARPRPADIFTTYELHKIKLHTEEARTVWPLGRRSRPLARPAAPTASPPRPRGSRSTGPTRDRTLFPSRLTRIRPSDYSCILRQLEF